MLPEKKRNTRKNHLASKLDSEAGKKNLKCFKDHDRTACHTPTRSNKAVPKCGYTTVMSNHRKNIKKKLLNVSNVNLFSSAVTSTQIFQTKSSCYLGWW